MRQLIPCTVSRRQFVKGSAAATIGALELGHSEFAAGGDEIKIALVDGGLRQLVAVGPRLTRLCPKPVGPRTG